MDYFTATFTGSAPRKNARSQILGVAPRMPRGRGLNRLFRSEQLMCHAYLGPRSGKSLNIKEISAAKARQESTKCQALQSLGHFCQHVRHSPVRISTKCLAYQPSRLRETISGWLPRALSTLRIHAYTQSLSPFLLFPLNCF